MTHTSDISDIAFAPVRKSIQVQADITTAFQVFTEDFDSWWPRSHHIGSSPMTRSIIEGRLGGRCYSEQEDGTDSDWGQILAWDPPHRFVMSWQISAAWQYEPDPSKSSEVEVRFTQLGNGATRVELEHRGFERMGDGGKAMRAGVDDASGWNGLLEIYAARAAAR